MLRSGAGSLLAFEELSNRFKNPFSFPRRGAFLVSLVMEGLETAAAMSAACSRRLFL
jgi:hypothetical protein